VFTYKLIGSGVVALAAISFATIQARANWEPSAPDWTIGAQTAASEPASGPESDGYWSHDSFELRRGLCELGNRPQRLSEENLDLCVLQSL
jgi:hypothetical protein